MSAEENQPLQPARVVGVLGRLGLGVSGVLKMVVKPGPPRRNVVLTGASG